MILYIITHLELGGAQKVCLTLCNGLAQRGLQTKLIAGNHGYLASDMHAQDTVVIPTLQREIGCKKIRSEIQTFFSLIAHIRALKKRHPHLIVHTHSTKAGLLGRWAAFFAGVRIRIHTVHGFSFHNHQPQTTRCIHRALEFITSLITTHYIYVSSADIAAGSALFPRFAHNHSLIRAAVDKPFFNAARQAQSFPDDGTPFIFGTIACFKPQKNLFDLLHAFAHVHKNNPLARLEIIGDGYMRPTLEKWIHERQLEGIITLHGWQENVLPHLLRWHAFVLSSLWEGLPCAIVEARLLKLPVLTYSTGGISDVIIHGKNGFLYPQKSWQELTQGMLTITRSHTLHYQLSKYQDQLESFSHEQMIAQHEQLYAKLSARGE